METKKENIYHVIAREVKEYLFNDEASIEAIADVLRSLYSTSDINKRNKVNREYNIDAKCLFTDIDTAIKYLNELKRRGYTSIEEKWSGYEDNYFVAIMEEEENEDEYYRRLADEVGKRFRYLENKGVNAMKAFTKKRIKEMEEEIKRLKESLY